MTSTLIQNGVLVTMNAKREVFRGDLRFANGEITEMGSSLSPQSGEDVVDAKGAFVIPGLIQTHIHLCQTLFRGQADDLALLDWLKKKIWPFEAAHNEASLRASARLGLLELQLTGTTSLLDMGTTHGHEFIFAEAERSKMRYWGGNCLMDRKDSSGPLYRPRDQSLEESRDLIKEWHKKTPLLQYAVSPRFAISCSESLLKKAARLREEFDLLFHTHASENKDEVKLVRQRTGKNNIQYLDHVGCLHEHAVIAHGIHMNRQEVSLMVKRQAGLTHCPSSNLKLASGMAPITSYLKAGMKIGLGADGAACNNNLDAFVEMRLAALLQKPLFGPTALPAREAFELATIGGARVLHVENQIGSLEVGKRADVVVVERNHPSCALVDDPYSALVYSCSGRDVRHVWCDGQPLVKEGRSQLYDSHAVNEEARVQLESLRSRLG